MTLVLLPCFPIAAANDDPPGEYSAPPATLANAANGAWVDLDVLDDPLPPLPDEMAGVPLPPLPAEGNPSVEKNAPALPLPATPPPPRPALPSGEKVADFSKDAALMVQIQEALRRNNEALKGFLIAAEDAETAAKIGEDAPRQFEKAATAYLDLATKSGEQKWRIHAARCLRSTRIPGTLDQARSQIITVLRHPSITAEVTAMAAAELRHLARDPDYRLVLTEAELAGFNRGIAKIFSSTEKGKNADFGSLIFQYRAAVVFQENGDHIWAAQMYRECLRLKDEKVASDLQIAKDAAAALSALHLPSTAPYPDTRPVNSTYLRNTSAKIEPAEYLEEYNPQTDVWKSIRDVVWGMVFSNKGQIKKIKEEDITTFKGHMERMLGADFEGYRPLFLQTIVYLADAKYYQNPLTARDWCLKNTFQNIKNAAADVPAYSKKEDLTFVERYRSQLRVNYLKSDIARKPYLLSAKEGKLMRGAALFDTQEMSTAFSGKGWAIYAMSPDGRLYAGSHKVSVFHHSSFMAAADAAGAGEMKVNPAGYITAISNKSGHYHPGLLQLVQTLKSLQAQKVDLSQLDDLQVFGPVMKNGKIKTEKIKWSLPGGAVAFLNLWKNSKQFTAAYHNLGFHGDPYAKP